MKEPVMDGFITHQIEGVSVDIEVVPMAPHGFTARFRIFGDQHDEPGWHAVHLTEGVFATEGEAEEAAKSLAVDHIRARQSRQHLPD
jgi:hypothetical protein